MTPRTHEPTPARGADAALDRLARRWAALRDHHGATGRCWVACSGGADSLALAIACARLRQRGIPGLTTVGLLHVHHGQQPVADDAAATVAAAADRLRLPLRSDRLRLPPGCAEATLRDARYAAFCGLLDTPGDRDAVLLTAHHADDVVETVVFRARRGAGRRGWAGIPAARPLQPGGTTLLLRPALGLRRAALHGLLALAPAGIAPVEDPSNADRRFARNRIRHELLPALRARHGADFDDRVLALVDRAARRAARREHAARALLAAGARQRAPWHVAWTLTGAAAPVTIAEAARLLHVHLCGQAPLDRWLGRVERLIATGRRGARLAAGGPLLVERTQRGLAFVVPAAAGAPPTGGVPLPAADAGPSTCRFGDTEWCLDAGGAAHGDAAADDDAWHTPRPPAARRARTRRPGDRLPDGRTLPDVQAAAGIARWDRDRLPVLVDAADRPLWTPGARRAPPGQPRLRVRCVHPPSGIPLPPPASSGIPLPPPAY